MAGYQPTGNGNGSGTPRNKVKRTSLYKRHCREIESAYPRVKAERIFEQLETFMVICEPDDDARHIGGGTWFLRTPDDFDPRIWIYFTYAAGVIVMQAAVV